MQHLNNHLCEDLHAICSAKSEIRKIYWYIRWRKFVYLCPYLFSISITHTIMTAVLLFAFPVPASVPIPALVYTWLMAYFISVRLLLPKPKTQYKEPRTDPHGVGGD